MIAPAAMLAVGTALAVRTGERKLCGTGQGRMRLPYRCATITLLGGSDSMKLTFWGAAGTVTGSMHLLETGGKRYLLDCGLYQGRRKDADAKNRNLPFEGSGIDAV